MPLAMALGLLISGLLPGAVSLDLWLEAASKIGFLKDRRYSMILVRSPLTLALLLSITSVYAAGTDEEGGYKTPTPSPVKRLSQVVSPHALDELTAATAALHMAFRPTAVENPYGPLLESCVLQLQGDGGAPGAYKDAVARVTHRVKNALATLIGDLRGARQSLRLQKGIPPREYPFTNERAAQEHLEKSLNWAHHIHRESFLTDDVQGLFNKLTSRLQKAQKSLGAPPATFDFASVSPPAEDSTTFYHHLTTAWATQLSSPVTDETIAQQIRATVIQRLAILIAGIEELKAQTTAGESPTSPVTVEEEIANTPTAEQQAEELFSVLETNALSGEDLSPATIKPLLAAMYQTTLFEVFKGLVEDADRLADRRNTLYPPPEQWV
jgi:hypothetical protein